MCHWLCQYFFPFGVPQKRIALAEPVAHDDGMSGAECLTSRRFLLGAEKIGDGQHGIEDFDDIVDY